MKSHIKLGRVGGVELGLHYSWLIIAALITFSLVARFQVTNPNWSGATVWVSAIVTGMLFFVCLFAHELSHAMVAKSRGLPIRRITLFFLGGMAQIEREAEDPGTEFWMAIAGPIASVLLGIFCLGVARTLFGWQWDVNPASPPAAILVWLGYINLVLAAFNLIPGFPMDGGRVLRAVIWWITGNGPKATRAAAGVGQLVGWLFVVWGIFRLFTGGGIGALWIALIGWFLVQAASATLMQAKAASTLHGLTVQDVMTSDCARVDAAGSLQNLVSGRVARGESRCFLAYEGGRLAGLVTLKDIRKIERERWPHTSIAQVMQRIEEVPSLAPGTPVEEALEKMGREDIGYLLVADHGAVRGLVSAAHILDVLRVRSELRAA